MKCIRLGTSDISRRKPIGSATKQTLKELVKELGYTVLDQDTDIDVYEEGA